MFLKFTSVLCFLTLLLTVFSEAKIYERCELAAVLFKQYNLPLDAVAHWVCIAQHSSQFNTQAYVSAAESATHGLFQISDKYWCVGQTQGQAAACNIDCDSLRDDDLKDDVGCVQRIFAEHQRLTGDGYTAWQAYEQHCFGAQVNSYIADCGLTLQRHTNPFLSKQQAQKQTANRNAVPHAIQNKYKAETGTAAKVYNRCELAKELFYKHSMPMEQIPTWVCIAQHESRFDTSAVGRLNADGSADHGLFQISDLYWCSHDRFQGKACGLQCSKLLDGDITDDVRCIKRIHTEHSRIAGDGFTAWSVYEPHCRAQAYAHVASCFEQQVTAQHANNAVASNPFLQRGAAFAGKVYKRCELAQELYFKHHFSMQDTATWVCIAQHESQYNTTAVVKSPQNANVMYHGLFQISDQYWCQSDLRSNQSNLCALQCDKLRNAALSDDVQCLRQIHDSHGFTAWPAFAQHCRRSKAAHIAQCFEQQSGKIYDKCELAQELLYAHKFPMQQIPIWTCIAQHESQFNTAAVGRRNADGSGDFGLFQISDLYWCSHDNASSKACNVPCNKLLDSNITDDVHCVRLIYKEHKRLFGNGFTAWSVYAPFCQNQSLAEISNCFNAADLQATSATLNPFLLATTSDDNMFASTRGIEKLTTNSTHNNNSLLQTKINENPFLKNQQKLIKNKKNPFLPDLQQQQQQQQQQLHYVKTKEHINKIYTNNPFLQRVSTASSSSSSTTSTTTTLRAKIKFTTIRPYVDSEYFRQTTSKTAIRTTTTTTRAQQNNATQTTTTTMRPTTRKTLERPQPLTMATKSTLTTTTTLRPNILTTTTARPTLDKPKYKFTATTPATSITTTTTTIQKTNRTRTTTTILPKYTSNNKLQNVNSWHGKSDTNNVTTKQFTKININRVKTKVVHKETITNMPKKNNLSIVNNQNMFKQINNTRIFNTSLKTSLTAKLASTTTKTTTTTIKPQTNTIRNVLQETANNQTNRGNIKFFLNKTATTNTRKNVENYNSRENPFDHPFFKQHKEQLRVFETTTISSKRKLQNRKEEAENMHKNITTTTTTAATKIMKNSFRENPFEHPFFKQHREKLSVFETTTISSKRKLQNKKEEIENMHINKTATTTKMIKNADNHSFRENPFDHPFFKQHREQLRVFETTTTSPQRKSFSIRNLSKVQSDTTTTTATTTRASTKRQKTKVSTTTARTTIIGTTLKTTTKPTTATSFMDYNKLEYLKRYANSQRKPQYSFKFGTNVY